MISLVAAFGLLSNVSSYAQTSDEIKLNRKAEREERLFGGDPVRFSVKLNTPIVIGIVNPAVEFRVLKHFTVNFEALGCFYRDGFADIFDGPALVAMAFGEFRYFPKEAFRGFYVAPNIGYGIWKLRKGITPQYWGSYPDKYQVGSNFMAGLTIGYHFTLTKHWGLELSWGGGYSIAHYEGHMSSDGSMYVGWNGSHEWMLAYKGAFNVVYKW